MAVAVKVHLPHVTPSEYDRLMSEVIHDMEVREHHAAKVVTHLAYKEGDGLTVIEVCDTQEDLDELTEFMMSHLDQMDIERPQVQPLDIHRVHV